MKSTFVGLAVTFAALAAASPQYGYGGRPAPTTTASCTLTICADYINSCSMMYGGCYPACPGLPTPTFTPPPCPTTTTTRTTTTRTRRPCPTICVDAVNECGIRYGGCYCETKKPPFTKPPCPTATAGPKKCGGLQGLQCGKGEICIDDPKSPCGIAVDCLGICVVEEFCGGFAGSACEDPNDVCIDDPRDECDPENGGADCGGLCIPKSWAK